MKLRLTGVPWSVAIRSHIATCLLLVCTIPTVAAAQGAPWNPSLSAAEAAYQEGRFPEAIRLFREADDAIAGLAAELAEQDEVLPPRAEEARDSMRCHFGLSLLATPSDASDSSGDRQFGLSQAHFGCRDAEAAIAASLLGHDYAAALLLRGHEFPPPFADRIVSPDARAVMRDFGSGSELLARDLNEAVRMAHAQVIAEHGIAATCGEPRGMMWTGPQEHRSPRELMQSWIEEEPPSSPPFASGAPHALARVTCSFPPRIRPEEQGFGDGAETVEFVFQRISDGRIRFAGSFAGFPELDCWTGVVMVDEASYPVPGQRDLYAFERVFGFDYGDDGGMFVVREAVLCDVGASVCRALPLSVYYRGDVYPDEDGTMPEAPQLTWDTTFRVEAGRLSLRSVRGAPRVVRRFGRGVSLHQFFREPQMDMSRQALVSSAASRRPQATSCPVRIADPDGETNLRSGPSSSSAVISTLRSGTEISVVERQGRWWRIDAPAAGWIWAPLTRQDCP